MKTFLTIYLLLVVACSVVNAAEEQKLSKKELNKILLDFSRQTNAQLPIMVDAETRADTTMVIDNQLHFKYTMVKVNVKTIDKKATAKEIKTMLVNNQCSNDNMLKLLKLGVSYHYMYQDKNGNIITTFKITKIDCGY